MSIKNFYSASIVDSNDGSGDGILTFDPQMLKDLDWREGDQIVFKNVDSGVSIINQSKDLRDRQSERLKSVE